MEIENSLGLVAQKEHFQGFGQSGTVFTVEHRKNCQCCHGHVNNCQGEACQNLGICFCMVVDEEDVKLKPEPTK